MRFLTKRWEQFVAGGGGGAGGVVVEREKTAGYNICLKTNWMCIQIYGFTQPHGVFRNAGILIITGLTLRWAAGCYPLGSTGRMIYLPGTGFQAKGTRS